MLFKKDLVQMFMFTLTLTSTYPVSEFFPWALHFNIKKVEL